MAIIPCNRIYSRRLLTLFLFLLALNDPSLGQEGKVIRRFDIDSIKKSHEFLLSTYGNHKSIPPQYALASLLALSYYPELKDTRIQFREKNIKTTMACRPKTGFIFKKKGKRVYKILIDNKVKKGKGILLSDIPFNAQVGLIGHELAHAFDFENKTTFGIIITGIRYIGPGFRRKYENQTDQETINRGLGWQLYDWSEYVFEKSGASPKYLEYKKKYYYDHNAIESIILEQ